MIDVSIGDWVKDYDGYLLIKFTSRLEYQQQFLDGLLYFNTAKYFAECESEGRADENEISTFVMNPADTGLQSANLEVINGQPMIVIRDYSKHPELYKKGTINSYSRVEDQDRKIICFYTEYVNVNEKSIAPFDHKVTDEFGNYCILIWDRIKFFNRMNKAIERRSDIFSASMGFVKYQDLNPGFNEWNPYRKDRQKFSYQNEFRITFSDSKREAEILNLGCSLRDIAVPVMANDLSQIGITENGGIRYPLYERI